MRLAFAPLILFAPALAPAAEPPAALTLKARAALALAFAAPPSYADRYAEAVADGRPLVVFVGQPVRAVPGALGVALATFPDASRPAVVVGVPAADGLRRVDLPGTPTDAAIRAALAPPGVGPVLPSKP